MTREEYRNQLAAVITEEHVIDAAVLAKFGPVKPAPVEAEPISVGSQSPHGMDLRQMANIRYGSEQLLAELRKQHPRQIKALVADLKAKGVRSPAIEGETR